MTFTAPPPPGPGVEGIFDAVADEYDQSGVSFFQPIAARLVERVAPRPGERALDLGCGRGAVTRLLADAVLPSGSVTAIDLSENMVAHVRRLVPDADVRRMDAAEPDLPPAAYDLATASAVLFFLPQPGAAVRRWLSLLRPGGRLGLTTFGPVDPVWEQVDRAVEAYRPPGVPDPRVLAADSPFATDDRFDRMLVEAGAVDVESRTEPLEVRVDEPDQWLRFSTTTGQRRAWAAVPPAEVDGLVATVRDLLESARDATGRIVLRQQVRYTVARAS